RLDSEIWFESDKLINEDLRFLAPTQVTERSDQRLIAVNEIRVDLYGTATRENRPLIIALEGIGDGIKMLEVGKIKLGRRQLAIALQPLQRSVGLADVTIRHGAQRPVERRTRIEPKRSIEKQESGVEVTSNSRARVCVNA